VQTIQRELNHDSRLNSLCTLRWYRSRQARFGSGDLCVDEHTIAEACSEENSARERADDPAESDRRPFANFAIVAVRPTLLFMTAFALNVTPHEAAHATAGYMLGFSSTLYQMWVNPDASAAAQQQLVAIAVAGPILSLILDLISFVLYLRLYSRRPSGLLFLMLAIVGFDLFLGPVAAAALGGDFNVALRSAGASQLLMNVVSVVGVLILPAMMYFIGKELSS
jgi:hypothetical protein